jgi:hypothetical protein
MRSSSVCALLSLCGALASPAAPPKPFSIQNVALAQYDDGPAVPASSYFVPGETVFLSFQVSGYKTEGEDERSIRLLWKVESSDPAGKPIIPPAAGKVATGLAQEDKNWLPKIRQAIQVPPFAPSGVYRINLWVKDEIAGVETRKEAEFQVRGRSVEPSTTLTIRNFHFYRGEEDKEPLTVIAYRPGDTIWIRFDIVGFKFADENQFDVAYGISVLRPNGDSLFRQPEAAAEHDQSFYPRLYVPAALSLNLTKDLSRGQYTIIVTAHDKVGSQSAEARQTVTVE